MSRTKRTIPHWATRENHEKLQELAKTVVNAPESWKKPFERDAFSNGYDKMGRKSTIGDPETMEEVWGENNKQEVRKRLARKVRRQGKAAIRKETQEDGN